MDKEETLIVFMLSAILTVPLGWFVHCRLNAFYVWLGRQFCKKHGLVISRYQCGPEFDNGVKTESSIVQFDCIDPNGERKLVSLRVWVFGIRKVLSIENYPEDQEASEVKDAQTIDGTVTQKKND